MAYLSPPAEFVALSEWNPNQQIYYYDVLIGSCLRMLSTVGYFVIVLALVASIPVGEQLSVVVVVVVVVRSTKADFGSSRYPIDSVLCYVV